MVVSTSSSSSSTFSTPQKPIPSKIYESLQMAPQRFVKPKRRIFPSRPRKNESSPTSHVHPSSPTTTIPTQSKESLKCPTRISLPRKSFPLAMIKKLSSAPRRSTSDFALQKRKSSTTSCNNPIQNITWAPKKKFPYRRAIQISVNY